MTVVGLDLKMKELGFDRIGRIDAVGRRSLWMKVEFGPGESESEQGVVCLRKALAFELRAGREGDDDQARVTSDNPKFLELLEVLYAARFAADWEDPDGLALLTEAELLELNGGRPWTRSDSRMRTIADLLKLATVHRGVTAGEPDAPGYDLAAGVVALLGRRPPSNAQLVSAGVEFDRVKHDNGEGSTWIVIGNKGYPPNAARAIAVEILRMCDKADERNAIDANDQKAGTDGTR